MDSSYSLLKEEINKTQEAQHDLAKWKLGVAAGLGAVAFGLAKNSCPAYWLLLFVPFVCAYIDLYSYQYQFRIYVIAKFLRDDGPGGDAVMQRYERECEGRRSRGDFSLGNWAGFGCSLGASALGPVFYALQPSREKCPDSLLIPTWAAVAIWLVGIGLIICLWIYFRHHTKKISQGLDTN